MIDPRGELLDEAARRIESPLGIVTGVTSRPEPQPITDAQKNGARCLVWYTGGTVILVHQPDAEISVYGPLSLAPGWYSARWCAILHEVHSSGHWCLGELRNDQGQNVMDLRITKSAIIITAGAVTHYLPPPPEVKP